MMRTPTLMLRDPDLINKVLNKDFWHFTDQGFPVDINASPINNGLFSMKGQEWKIMRSKLSPAFTSSKLRSMLDQIKDCSDQLIRNLKLKLMQSDVLEVRSIICDYSIDVIGTCAFGLQLNTIVDDNSLFRKAGRAVFAPSLRLLLKDMFQYISPVLRKMLKIYDFPKFATDFFENSFRQTMEYREKNRITRNDFVQCLLQAKTDLIINKSEPSVSFKEMDIIANAFFLFLAGFETVSTTMSFCLYELALKKPIQDRVREEILTAKSNHNGDLNNGFLAELPYVEMVLAETLRMYPPLSIIFREASKSYQVPGEDLVIEKGTKIAIPAYSLHMDPMYYPDPITFNPERFTPEEKAKRPSGVYMPFGEGPRQCLGKRFAEIEMKLALSEILSKYEIEPCEKTDAPMKFKKLTLNTVPENDIWNKSTMLSLASTSIFNGTWFMNTCALSIVLGCLFYYFSTSTYGYWQKRNVPYERPVPLFGNFTTIIFGFEHITDLFNRLYKHSFEHKYWGIYQMRTPTLMLRDPDLITKVLIKDFSHFTDHGIPVDIDATPLSNHLFAMNGQKWKIMRNKMSPVFTSSKLKNMQDQIKECSDQLMKNLEMNLIQSDVLEVRDIMGDYSTDVIGTCAFGLQLNAIVDKDSPFRKAGKAVFTVSLRSVVKDLATFISPSFRKLLKIADVPPEATDFFESSFNQTMDYRTKNNIVRNDLVQCLMQARQDLIINKLEPSVNYRETDIAANAFLMFVAGFETVSTTMSYCLYELALKKHIQDRVRNEILTAKSKHNGEFSNEFLTELSYLEMVISETLRMYPPLSIIIREASESYKVPGEDLVIEKGTKIAIPAYSLHMDPMYYPDPITFNPERFTPEEKSKRPSGVYMPFGEGPRICLGKRFAEMEMKLALSKLLTMYQIEPCEKTDVPMRLKKLAPTTVPENGIWLRFKRIKS
ncbi:probable cytochrome P450 6a14 [Adelges cooleyi]|uniref:probable cytochrome P450 6a14 n=1 Tax=Adelges cooleyi TaxID=133065 RepID=UPI0021808490|nr:probable cytochrome P450 6a14 [Adelges cooleyi]